MINGVSYNNNSPTFTGMSVKSLKTFIPELTEEAAAQASARLNAAIPNDFLSTMIRGSNIITHSVSVEGTKIPIGEIRYKGSNTPAEKLEFLDDVVDMIKKGTLYT